MNRLLIVLWLLVFTAVSFGQTPSFTMDSVHHQSTTLTSPTTVVASNLNYFTYYGFPTTNYAGTIACSGMVPGGLASFPPVQASFTVTGTSCELIVDCIQYPQGTWSIAYWQLTDGNTTSAYTNESLGNEGHPVAYIPVTFATNGIHNLMLSVHGNFDGVNVVTGNTVTNNPLRPKPNVLLVMGDSYVQGYNPNGVPVNGLYSKYWFDGWVWQLVRMVPNTIAIPSGVSGSGFTNNGVAVNYPSRVVSDVCAVYTNLVNSGAYNNIFIAPQGSINDDTYASASNNIYVYATNVLTLIQQACPTAHIFMVGNWLGVGGETVPVANDFSLEWAMTNAAATVHVPIYDPISAHVKNAANYYIFYPSTGGTDSVHPSAAGYAIMANWVNTNLAYTFGAVWTNNVSAGSAGSGASLSVTDFGAKGDAVSFQVSTTSNSPMVSVVGTNVFTSADIGKVIEVFRAGPWTYWSNNPAMGFFSTNQDTICFITNVTSGTNLWGTIPQGWTTNAWCTVGNNNQAAFQAAITTAQGLVAGGTNPVTINIPGTNISYLIVGPQETNAGYIASAYNDGGAALYVQSGGLIFNGQGSNVTLLNCGAGMDHVLSSNAAYQPYGQSGAYVPLRGILFEFLGPISNSGLPVEFNNLIFDGGVQQGLQSYSYWIPWQGNGDGWDTSDHVVADVSYGTGYQMETLRIITNCLFQHWRGEMLVCTTDAGGTNTFNDIENCTFYDGNASADNFYYGQHVHGCTFNQLAKVLEFYMGRATLPSLFDGNYVTNISPYDNFAITILGALAGTTMPGYTISNNILHTETGVGTVSFQPVCNVTVVSNYFIGHGNAITIPSAGFQPSVGAVSTTTNLNIVQNDFTGYQGTSFYDAGFSLAYVLMSSNSNFRVNVAASFVTNVILSCNSGASVVSYYDIIGANITGGSFMIDQTNNAWLAPTKPNFTPDGGAYGTVNVLSYGNGREHSLQYDDKYFYCDDVTKLNPPGAILSISANTFSGLNPTHVYPSLTNPVVFITITNQAAPTILHWTGSAWSLSGTTHGTVVAGRITMSRVTIK